MARRPLLRHRGDWSDPWQRAEGGLEPFVSARFSRVPFGRLTTGCTGGHHSQNGDDRDPHVRRTASAHAGSRPTPRPNIVKPAARLTREPPASYLRMEVPVQKART